MLYRIAARRVAVHARPRAVVDSSLMHRIAQTSSLHTPASLPAKFQLALCLSSLTRSYATTRANSAGTAKRASKKPAKKPAPKKKKPAKKTAAKKKKPAKKAAPKKKKAAPLTETQKLIQKVKTLKAQALLDEPKYKPTSKWLLTISQNRTAVSAEASRERARQYKALSAGQLQELQTTADANKRSNEQLKKQWVAQHSPFEIYRANLARNALGRIARMPVPKDRKRSLVGRKVFSKLEDPRVPKRPNSGFFRFISELRQQGNLADGSVAEATKDATAQWKALPAEERKRYNDVHEFEREEYVKQVRILMPERFEKKPGRKAKAAS